MKEIRFGIQNKTTMLACFVGAVFTLNPISNVNGDSGTYLLRCISVGAPVCHVHIRAAIK